MRVARKPRATVQDGGRIEVRDPAWPVGETVEVTIQWPGHGLEGKRSALEILARSPGHRLFKTADEVDAYIREERDSWDR